jgi:predicted dehydrogenase
MQVTLKVGVVGSGAWARRAHFSALHRSRSAELAGVWGRNADAAGRLADAAGCRNYATLKELMEDVDIVDIVVAPNAQATLAIEAARHGVHLFLEKPLAGIPRDANLVVEEIERASVNAIVFVSRMFDPVRRAWLDDHAGRVDRVRITWLNDNMLMPPFVRSWRSTASSITNVGPHVLSQLEYLLGPIESTNVLQRGDHGDVQFTTSHRGGGRGDVELDLRRPGVRLERVQVWNGDASDIEERGVDSITAIGVALDRLIAAIGGAMPISPTELWSVRSAARHVDLIDKIDYAYPRAGTGSGFQQGAMMEL